MGKGIIKKKPYKIMTDQNERAFQKQDAVHLNSKSLLSAKSKKGGVRYYKNVGLGFKTPKEAIEGTYIDKKCPFTSDVKIRGRILEGIIYILLKKYQRFEKRHRNIPVHCSPCFRVKEGDIITVGQCRPLSKTVRFNVLKVKANEIFGSVKKQFMLF